MSASNSDRHLLLHLHLEASYGDKHLQFREDLYLQGTVNV